MTSIPRSPLEPGASVLVVLFGKLEYDGRVQRMVELLVELGVQVTLVDLKPDDDATIDAIGGVERVRVPVPIDSGVVRRHLKFISAVCRTTVRARPRVVLIEDYLATAAGLLASRLAKARLVYDAHELITPQDEEHMTLREYAWYRVERLVARRADLIIAANPERARIMATHYRLSVVPEYMLNIPKRRPYDAGASENLGPVRRDPSRRTVLYQGDVSAGRGLSRFVEALAFLPPDYRLVIVGDGPDLQRIKRLGAPWVSAGRFVALGRVPHRLLPAIAAQADVGIVSYPYRGLNNRYCSPNKLFEYAQAYVPVVATDQPILRGLVAEYDIGRLVGEQDTPAMIAGTIRYVAENKNKYRESLTMFLEDYTLEAEATRLRAALAGILT